MNFRQCRKRRIICRRRFVVANTAAIVLLLECMLVSSLLSMKFFCNGHKNPSTWSSDSSSSFWKLPKSSTTTTRYRSPVLLLGTTSDQNQIAAWVTQQTSRGNLPHLKRTSRLLPCAGYYIPSPTTMGSRKRNSSLFSRNRDETDNGDHDMNYNQRNRNEMDKSEGANHRKGLLSILGNFKYGVNRVNKDFLGLTWKVYSQTFLWMAPFVVLLFVILPLWSKSSSPFLQVLAIQVQGFLKRTFEVLAEGSRVFFVRPMHGLAQLIVNWCSTGGASAANNSVWKTRSSRKSMLLWGLFWGPVFEEFIFRFAFRGLWKVLFRPISIRSKNKNTTNSADTHIVEPDDSMLVLPLSFVTRILSDFRNTPRPEPKPRYTNRNWRIASGICFGIAHFSNFFPIDPSQYTMDGEIRLPSGTVRERFLLSLFPGDFAFQSVNKEFCLVSMVLVGAIYQALHCFINTMILYGPLLDSPRSKKGGFFAAIGAHIAWNANVLWLVSNLKLRVVLRLVSLKLVSRNHQKQNRKRQDRIDQEESKWQ